MGFHRLQQVVHLNVGVAVVAVLDLAALAEQRVGLVEEHDRSAIQVEAPIALVSSSRALLSASRFLSSCFDWIWASFAALFTRAVSASRLRLAAPASALNSRDRSTSRESLASCAASSP